MLLKFHICVSTHETWMKFMKELFNFIFFPLSGFYSDLMDLRHTSLRRPSVNALKSWPADPRGCIIPSWAVTRAPLAEALASAYIRNKACDRRNSLAGVILAGVLKWISGLFGNLLSSLYFSLEDLLFSLFKYDTTSWFSTLSIQWQKDSSCVIHTHTHSLTHGETDFKSKLKPV